MNRFFLRCWPRVVGFLAIGKLRVQTGATSLRATLTLRSQKGNIAHPVRCVTRARLTRETAETNANLEVTRFAYSDAGDLLALTEGLQLTLVSIANRLLNICRCR